MIQNGGGGGGMAQFGQMGLNQFSQMQTPQAGGGGPMMMPMMMMPPQAYGGYGMFPNQSMMMMPNMQQSQMVMPNNSQAYQETQPNDEMQQRQYGQNQGQGNEGMGRRNQSQGNISINQPISKPSEGFQVQDRYGKQGKQQEYSQMLKFQLDMKKQKKDELKNYEQAQIDNLKNERLRSQAFASQGQLVRDELGNIANTKFNPTNPNYQPIDWFSHVAHKDEFQNQHSLAQSVSVPSLQNVPDLALYDPDLKRQREIGQRLQTAKNQQFNQNQNQEKIMRAQEAFENSVPQTSFARPPAMNLGGEQDLLKMRKRQQALELQREQMQQIEEKKRQKQLRGIQESRERDLEDLKVQREVDEINKRLMNDFYDNKLGNRNLHETNFNILNTDGANRRSQSDLEIGISQSRLSDVPPPAPIKSSIKKQVVINEDIEPMNGRVEQRVVRELPIEITTTVKETLNTELMRIRNEMNMQSNSLGEQILGMKSQLMKANERRFHAEEDVKKLRDELKKTQYIDEIRQRELYNAFVLTEKPKIYSNNTQRLYDADLQFELPTRPKPYYNLQDPYLDNYNKEFEKDNHGILQDKTKHIPLGEYDYSSNAVSDQRKIDEQMLIDRHEFNDLDKKAFKVDRADFFDLPDDYLNRQNLYYGKSTMLEGEDDQIGDYKDYLQKNQDRLDKLGELDTLERKGELDKLDEALFDLASHSNQESRFKKRYEQEENLNDIEDFINFQSKLNRYN